MRITASAMSRTAIALVLLSLTMAPAISQDIDDRLVANASTRAELSAADAIDAEESPVNRLTMTNDFLTTYPESDFRHQILLTRLRTYVDLNNNQGIMATGPDYVAAENAFFESKTADIDDPEDVDGYAQFELNHFLNLTYANQEMMNASSRLSRPDDAGMYAEMALASSDELLRSQANALGTDSPEYQEAVQRNRQAKIFFLQTAMTAYQNANNADKTVEYAERALELDPRNLASLLTVSTVMSERPPANPRLQASHFEKAKDYAEDALSVLEQFLDAAGAQIAPDRRNSFLSGAHFTLGTIYLNQEEWGDAQDAFEEALEYTPRDANAYLRLGMAYARDEEVDEAMEALARSVFLNGPEQARQLLEQVYEAANRNLTGLEAFIQAQGSEIE